MADTRATVAAGSLVVLVLVGALAFQAGLVPTPWADQHDGATVTITDGGAETPSDESNETVTVADEGGATLAEVQVEVADTRNERYTGLSEHESLEEGRGMLFVHEEEQNLTYVMRNMSFGIDIVFVDANGTITRIHSARAPGPNEDGESMRYSGRGKYVLEVPKGYTAEHNISEGDRIEIEYHDNSSSDRNA